MSSLPTPNPQTPRWSPAEHAAVMQAARARALQARREAADAFWAALGDALAGAARAITRRAAAFMPRRAPLRGLEG